MIHSKSFASSPQAAQLALKTVRARQIRENTKKIITEKRADKDLALRREKVQNARAQRLEKLETDSTRAGLYADAVREMNRLKNPASMAKVNRHPRFEPEPISGDSSHRSASTGAAAAAAGGEGGGGPAEAQWREEVWGPRAALRESLGALQRRKRDEAWAQLARHQVAARAAEVAEQRARLQSAQRAHAAQLTAHLGLREEARRREKEEAAAHARRVAEDVARHEREQRSARRRKASHARHHREAFERDAAAARGRAAEELRRARAFDAAQGRAAAEDARRERAEAAQRKEEARERARRAMDDNMRDLDRKAQERRREEEENLRLGREMKERLDRQERDRQAGFEKIARQQEESVKRIEPIYNKMMKELAETAAREQAQHEAYVRRREQTERAKDMDRSRVAKEQQQYLIMHQKKQEELRRQKQEEDRKMGEELLRRDQEALKADHAKKKKAREQNMRIRRELEEQIAAKKKAQSEACLAPMSQAEASLNRTLLTNTGTNNRSIW